MGEIEPREFGIFTTGKPNEEIRFAEPSSEQIVEHIRQLDNEVHTGVRLRVRHFLLHILGGNEGRVVLRVTKLLNGRMAQLIDPTYNGEDEILDIHYACECDEEHIRDTIPQETAVEIASYLWTNGTFPPGLTWRGDDLSG